MNVFILPSLSVVFENVPDGKHTLLPDYRTWSESMKSLAGVPPGYRTWSESMKSLAGVPLAPTQSCGAPFVGQYLVPVAAVVADLPRRFVDRVSHNHVREVGMG